MTEVRYVPAARDGWRAAVSPRALAVLSPAVTPQTAEAVWRRLDGGGIGALVEALTGAFGTSLTAIPPFALVVVEDEDVRIAVRGPLDVVVEGEAGAVEVSGRGVATWAERLVSRPHRVTVVPDGEPGSIDEADALPLASGVVPVSGIVLMPGGVGVVVAAVPAPAAAVAAHRGAASAAEATTGSTGARATGPVETDADTAAPEPATSEPATTHGPDTTGSIEAAAGDTWIPALTQVPLDEVPLDEVPGANVPSASVDRAPAESAADPAPADDSTIATPRTAAAASPDVGGAWAATVVRGAVPDTSAAPAGDHDGATISVAEARAMRGQSAGGQGGTGSQGGTASPFEPVADVPSRRPATGRVRLSSGQVVELERPVVIGRRPRSPRASGAELPTLIAVESPEGDISRSHVEIRAEGEHVLVTDLATTNGTVLRRVGQDPVRLHPSEPTMVVTGDVLDLGDGVTVTFEDLP